VMIPDGGGCRIFILAPASIWFETRIFSSRFSA
jgi:hypothetical protein